MPWRVRCAELRSEKWTPWENDSQRNEVTGKRTSRQPRNRMPLDDNYVAKFTLQATPAVLILVIVEDYMKDLPREILQESLIALHAERLPSWVVERLASDFNMKVLVNLRQLAAREITNRKIARLFTAGRGNEERFRGETVVSPPDEQARSNSGETGALARTTAP